MHSKKQYRFVEHTADVEFVASGKNAEDCFRNALMAMFDTMCYTDKVSSLKSKTITFLVKDRANNIEDLLWYSLQDTLSISDSKRIFAYKASSIKIKEGSKSYSISMKIYGKPKTDKISKLDVKGVSRYNLGIRKTKRGIEATVVLDV